MQDSAKAFVALLKHPPSGGAVFNPWWEVDLENDIDAIAPRIRRAQLTSYLQAHSRPAKVALIGEALGYRGGHFTGIAMTSERILLADGAGANLAQGCLTIKPRRTSKPSLAPKGFAEPTATIVWRTMRQLQFRPDEFLLWNAFPWHPYDPRKGMLSNRRPTAAELDCSLGILSEFLVAFPAEKILALGRIAASQIARAGCNAVEIRHPASGGARRFQEQIAAILGRPTTRIEARNAP